MAESAIDQELKAIKTIAEALEPLDPGSRRRALSKLCYGAFGIVRNRWWDKLSCPSTKSSRFFSSKHSKSQSCAPQYS
jgi:hypothetical protein